MVFFLKLVGTISVLRLLGGDFLGFKRATDSSLNAGTDVSLPSVNYYRQPCRPF